MQRVAGSVEIPSQPRLSLARQVGYGSGQVAGQIFRDAPSLLLLFFLTNTLGINPALAGISIFAPKLFWGITFDFSVGIACDRWVRRFPRRFWLLAGAILAPIALILLFRVPDGTGSMRAGYVVLVFSFYMLAFSVFTVPYLAIGAEITTGPRERTILMAWRLVFTAVGVLIGDSLAPMIVQYRGSDQAAYRYMSVVIAITCSVSLIVAFLSAPKISMKTLDRTGFKLRSAIDLLRNTKFSVLMVCTLIQLVGLGMTYATFAYFLTYNCARADAFQQLGIIVLISSLSVMGSQPIWVAMSIRYGKKNVYSFACIANAAIQIVWGSSAHLPMGFFYGYGIIFGIMNSGWQLMSISILSDIIAEDEAATNSARAGLFSAIWTVTDKVGFALGGTLLTGSILAAFGFHADGASVKHAQSGLALLGIVLSYSFIPAILNVSAGSLYYLRGAR